MTEVKWGPGQLLGLSGIYWRTCALHAAVRLDLFTEIGESGAEAAELASGMGADRRGLTTLLNALVAIELLERQGNVFRCPADIHALLSRSSPRYLGDMVLHHANLMESWCRLSEAVSTGSPVRGRSRTADESTREAFLLGMRAQGRMVAPLVAASVDLSGRRRLLDLGGGPGAFAIEFCRAFAGLEACVYDLPGTAQFADETIAGSGLGDRVHFVGGDYLVDPVPAGFDVAWLSHILHAESPESCRRIVSKAAGALAPGGLLLVHEFVLEDSGDGPAFPALFSLNMLLGTEGGRSYRERELIALLREAGLADVRRLVFEGPSQSGILAGVKRI